LNIKGNTIFWAIIACLLWSTAYASIKIGLQFDSPFHFAGVRFIISGLMILPFTVRPSLYIGMIKNHFSVIVWVTILQIVINYSLFYQGLNLVPGALGAVLSWLLIPDEHPEWLTISGMIIITVSLVMFYQSKKEIASN
jgi:drug/metabolite transporter (DMT)-like permease